MHVCSFEFHTEINFGMSFFFFNTAHIREEVNVEYGILVKVTASFNTELLKMQFMQEKRPRVKVSCVLVI